MTKPQPATTAARPLPTFYYYRRLVSFVPWVFAADLGFITVSLLFETVPGLLAREFLTASAAMPPPGWTCGQFWCCW